MKVNSLPLSTSILKDKTHVIWWRDLTVPVSNWPLGDLKLQIDWCMRYS